MRGVTAPRPVLIVDDDLPTQKLLEALIRHQGLESRIVANGADAIACLRRDANYACVILDLMMPAVSGHEVIEFVGRERLDVPVIVCTAAGVRATENLDSDVVRAILRKPFDIDELAAILTALAKR